MAYLRLGTASECFILVAAAVTRFTFASPDRNDGVHLAVHPQCGTLGGNFTDVNAGIDLSAIRTIVTFGDSYTDGGVENGSALLPPVVIPPDPHAGNRQTNGPVWIEDIAHDINATLLDYAVAGAVADIALFNSSLAANSSHDFVQQEMSWIVSLFLSQGHTFDPRTTLYTVFFGINDWTDAKSFANGDDLLLEDAQVLLQQIQLLASPPTNARSFLVTDVYGRGTHTAGGEAWKQSLFDGLSTFNQGINLTAPLNVAFGDFSRIWDGVLGTNPGYEAFGYTSNGSCIPGAATANSTDGECADPSHTFYWIHGHPSKETHRIMADYVEAVLIKCSV